MDGVFTQGHALLIGVGADLPHTIDDAVGLANILRDPSRCAYPALQVQLLTGENATRAAAIAGLDQLAKASVSDSTVVIYFSGHGYQVRSSIGESYFLMTYGYNVDRLSETAISGTELTEHMRAIKAKKILVLLDCCHAGGVGDFKALGLQLTKYPLPVMAQQMFTEGSGRVLVASSQADELSYAGKPYSAFTLALVEALCGVGVAKKDGYIRVADLALHTREVVPKRTAGKQHPILQFAQADNYILAYYSGGDTQPKKLPFPIEPEIEPTPGAWTTIDHQTYAISNPQNTELIGTFHGPVKTGGNDQTAFIQPGWTVHGDVTQAQGNITVMRSGEKRGSAALPQIFANLEKQINLLPVDDKQVIQLIVSQAKFQADKLQYGDMSYEAQIALEKRLRSLYTINSSIGNMVTAELANPSAEIAREIQRVANKVRNEVNIERG